MFKTENYKPVGSNIRLGEVMFIWKTKFLDNTTFTHARRFDKYFAF